MGSNKVAFFDGDREISYERFSRDITAAQGFLKREFPEGCELLGLAASMGPYLHWVLHAACTIERITTLAMRPNQGVYNDIVVAGSIDLNHLGPSLVFDHKVLAELRATLPEQDNPGFDLFLEALRTGEDTVNRIVLTSGSTGISKAVPLTCKSVMGRFAAAERLHKLSAEHKMLTTLGRDTVGGYYFPLECFMVGATVLNLRRGGQDREQFAAMLRASTLFYSVPAIVQGMLTLISEPVQGAETRVMATMGSRLEPETADRCRALLAADVSSIYGSTEVGWVTRASEETVVADPSNTGKVYDEAVVEIVDAEGQLVLAGDDGIIRIHTPWMSPGYWDDGLVQPFEGGWFYPGDTGRLTPDGDLLVSGRTDDRLNYNGEKFDAVGLESQLKALAGIDDAFVAVVNIAARDRMVVMACSSLDPESLRTTLASVVSRVPFDLLPAAHIPRNHMGKIERKRLSEYCRQILMQTLEQ